jgi:haloalkane dehalogenase
MTETKTGFVQVDDLRIAYREQGSGPAVLLLHGWPTSSHLWREVMKPIAEQSRAVAIDLPGFGASDKPLDRRYDFELFERTLDVVTTKLGMLETGLVVHDISGPIGVRWAIHNPTRVTKLALLNTYLYVDDLPAAAVEVLGALADSERQLGATSPEGLESMMRDGMADPSHLTPELLAAVLEPFQTDESRRALAAAGTQLSPRGLVEIARRTSELKMPVRVIYGTRDPLFPVAKGFERLKREVPQAVVTSLDSCGHFLQEDAPREVGALLARFFAEE